jgi:hypothetical protein
MAIVTVNHLGARGLIRHCDLTKVFWIKLIGESRRTHQVEEEDGELTAFGGGQCLPYWRKGL